MVKLSGDYSIERIDADGQDVFFVTLRIPAFLLDVKGGIDSVFIQAKKTLLLHKIEKD